MINSLEEIINHPSRIKDAKNHSYFCFRDGEDKLSFEKVESYDGNIKYYTWESDERGSLCETPFWFQQMYVFLQKKLLREQAVKMYYKHLKPSELEPIVWAVSLVACIEIGDFRYHEELRKGTLSANEQNGKYIERVCEMMESYFHRPDVFAVKLKGFL